MDLTFNEPELAFRDELRAWLADHDPGREPDGDEDANYPWRVEFQRRLAARRLGCRALAARVRRPRRNPDPVGDLLRGAGPRRRAAAGQRARPAAGRADDHDLGHPRAEGALPARRS